MVHLSKVAHRPKRSSRTSAGVISRHPGNELARVRVVTATLRKPIRASTAQEGIWVTEQSGTAAGSYIMPLVVWFDGNLVVSALEAACSDIIRRHTLLRCSAQYRDGKLVLVETGQPALQVVPMWVKEDDDHISSAVADHLASEIRRGFDLAHEPLFRMLLVLTGGKRHAFIAVAHHLIFDGISKDILLSDLALAYNERKYGKEPVFSILTQSVDDILDEQRRIAEDRRADATTFWANRWRPEHTPVLPGLRFVPAAGEAGEAWASEIDAEAVDVLSRAAKDSKRTRFDLLLTGLHVLLFKYGNRGSSVAIDVSTRTSALRHVGSFVNELPVFVDLHADLTFNEAVDRVATELRDLNGFRTVPLSRAGIRMPISTTVAPVSMSYRVSTKSPDFDGVSTKVDWLTYNGTVHGALHIQMLDREDLSSTSCPSRTIKVSVQYSPRAVSSRDVKRTMAHLENVLRAACANPAVKIRDIPLMGAEERAMVLGYSSGPVRPYDLRQTVVSVFRQRAVENSEAPALTFEGNTITYMTVDELSERVARHLLTRGIGAGTVVALKLKRSPLLPITMLGVLKSGAAYLPIDSECPRERIEYMLSDSEAALIVTDDDKQLRRPFANGRRSVRVVDVKQLTGHVAETQGKEQPSRLSLAAVPSAGDLAYIIFTSGSTGRPKGVEVDHRSLANLMSAFGELIGEVKGHWLAHTAPSFDIAAIELMYPLLVGGRVVLAGDREAFDGAALVDLLSRERVSHVQATPSGWSMLIAAGFNHPGIVAVSGGETLPPRLAREIHQRAGRLINIYGPTEGTIWCIASDVDPDSRQLPIGRPLSNTSAYVVDSDLELLPIGVPGELCIGGECVARGYRNRSELTQERFRFDKFHSDDSGQETTSRRLYMTGDVAQLNDAGELLLMGRMDSQVKLRGHRIELGEIETALTEHGHVMQAAVVLHGDNIDGKLVAYVSPKSGESCGISDLRAHLERMLPGHMVPSAYIVLDQLPVTSNGKLDRSRLPDPIFPLRVRVTGPTDELTEDVRQMVCRELSVDWINDDDDLFDLGAHSLSMLRIMGRIMARYGVDIPIDMMFDTPTLSAVVDAIKSVDGTEGQ